MRFAYVVSLLAVASSALGDVQAGGSPSVSLPQARGGGECPAEGDCCEANGTPSCNDPECCNAVCLVDPFCCDVEWDQICADRAADMCLLCGAGEPCSTPALCDGDVNGDGVLDPLDTGYILARLGADVCADDNCEDAFVLENGLTPFSTINATTDGLYPPDVCGCDFGCDGMKDIWYDYTATCDGYGVVSTCNDDEPATGEADFDTFLFAFEGCDCPPEADSIAGCNDEMRPDAAGSRRS